MLQIRLLLTLTVRAFRVESAYEESAEDGWIGIGRIGSCSGLRIRVSLHGVLVSGADVLASRPQIQHT